MQATKRRPDGLRATCALTMTALPPADTRAGQPIPSKDAAAGYSRISGSRHGANLDEDQHVMRIFAGPQFFMHGAEFHAYESRRLQERWQGRIGNAAVTGKIGHKGH